MLLPIPLKEIFMGAIILWIAILLINTIRIVIKHFLLFRQRRNYKVGMFSKESVNSTLHHVEENSVIDMIMGYYNRPLFYIEIADKRTKDLQILKASENQKTRHEVEEYIQEQLRYGSRIKVLTVRDSTFHITVYHEKKYWG